MCWLQSLEFCITTCTEHAETVAYTLDFYFRVDWRDRNMPLIHGKSYTLSLVSFIIIGIICPYIKRGCTIACITCRLKIK